MLGRIGYISVSVALHAGVIAWISQSADKPVVPDQQMVEVTVMAEMPAPEVMKPITNKVPKLEKKPEAKIKPKEEASVQPVEEVLSDAKPAPEVKAAVTTPVFDAAYLNNPPPHYPAAAKRRNVEGRVVLDVRVSEAGRPTHVSVINSSGSDLLDDAAFKAVSNWQFTPAQQNGSAVAANVHVPVVFKLK